MNVLALNKRASYDYEFLEKFTAGLVLTGAEVKSVKNGSANLKGSFVVFRGRGGKSPEAYLINAYIGAYRYSAYKESYVPERARKLLLKRREISHLIGKQQEKGLTLVPIKLYTERSLVKLEFAIARGKKQYDKRQSIKARDLKKQLSSIKQSGDL
jgi:SsrA-binding protein